MDINKLTKEALRIRKLYSELEKKNYGKPWGNLEIFNGFVADVGDLSRLILAKEGKRKIENIYPKLDHEISDCLWALLILAENYKIKISKTFPKNMKILEKRIKKELYEV
jgi:NTP pyrophosphatase (non-canonical NTP hydrolase)